MDSKQKTSTAAAASFIVAVASYLATCTGHPGWGLFAAIAAMPLGVLGILLAVSPRIKGGILSVFALIFAAVGAIISILAITGSALF